LGIDTIHYFLCMQFRYALAINIERIRMREIYRNLKIRNKILFGFSAVAVIMLLMMTYSVTGLRQIIFAHENLAVGHWLRRDTRFDYRHAFEEMQRHTYAMLAYAAIGDTANIELSSSRAAGAFRATQASLDDYRRLVLLDTLIPDDEKELRRVTSERVDDILAEYFQSIVPVVFQHAMNGDVAAGIQALRDGQIIADRLDAANADLNIISDIWHDGIEAENRRTETMTYTIIAIGFISIVLLTLAITILTAQVIGKPIILVADTLRNIAQGEGDLTAEVKTSSSDEIGKMASYFNQTLGRIKSLVVDIKKEGVILSTIGNDLAANMNETTVSVNKIASNVQTIKGRVVEQSSSVSQTYATMDRLVKNIDALNGHIEKVSNNVTSASSAIDEMAASIRSVTETLNKNTENVKALTDASEVGRNGLNGVAEDIKEIARDSEGLFEINAVIENIASQTNLLSMNAAIEAAHAGEAGRGFAVVASEIRKLAENSSKQSKTISTVLKKIKASIDKITRSTGTVLDRFESIDQGVKVVAMQEDNILRAMEEQEVGSRRIVDGVTEITELTRQVKMGSNNMLESAKAVIKESEALKMVTQEINSNMTEIAGETDNVNHAVNYANDASNKNRQAIGNLIKGVSRFKVD